MGGVKAGLHQQQARSKPRRQLHIVVQLVGSHSHGIVDCFLEQNRGWDPMNARPSSLPRRSCWTPAHGCLQGLDDVRRKGLPMLLHVVHETM